MMHMVPKCQKKYSKDVEWDKNNVIEKEMNQFMISFDTKLTSF